MQAYHRIVFEEEYLSVGEVIEAINMCRDPKLVWRYRRATSNGREPTRV